MLSLFIRAEWTTAPLPDSLLTIQEADPPEARVLRAFDVHALVQRHDDALLQVQPVVGADRQSQQPQAADCKDAAQQCQGLPAARAHCHSEGEGAKGRREGGLWQLMVKNKCSRKYKKNICPGGMSRKGLHRDVTERHTRLQALS